MAPEPVLGDDLITTPRGLRPGRHDEPDRAREERPYASSFPILWCQPVRVQAAPASSQSTSLRTGFSDDRPRSVGTSRPSCARRDHGPGRSRPPPRRACSSRDRRPAPQPQAHPETLRHAHHALRHDKRQRATETAAHLRLEAPTSQRLSGVSRPFALPPNSPRFSPLPAQALITQVVSDHRLRLLRSGSAQMRARQFLMYASELRSWLVTFFKGQPCVPWHFRLATPS